jgi:hypothetical protein
MVIVKPNGVVIDLSEVYINNGEELDVYKKEKKKKKK